MNLYLHGIEPDIRIIDTIDEAPGPTRYNAVLTESAVRHQGCGPVPDPRRFYDPDVEQAAQLPLALS